MKKSIIFLVTGLWFCKIGSAQTIANLNQSNGYSSFNQNKQLQILLATNLKFAANYSNESVDAALTCIE